MKSLLTSIMACLLFFGCATTDDEPVGPEYDGPDEMSPEKPWTAIDGEFEMDMRTELLNCGDVVFPPVIYTKANVVQQSYDRHGDPAPDRFDLRAISDDIMSYSNWDLSRERDGWFESDVEWSFWWFGAQSWIRRAFGGSVDATNLNFFQDSDWGGYDSGGNWISGCRLVAYYDGRRRYVPWSRKPVPVPTVDRKWRVEQTVLEEEYGGSKTAQAEKKLPIDIPEQTLRSGIREPLRLRPRAGLSPGVTMASQISSDTSEETSYVSRNHVIADTALQALDGSRIDIRGLRFNFSNVHRAPDGSVDVWIWQSNGLEFTLKGSVTETEFDLIFTWKWTDPFTGDLVYWTKIAYEGRPRYEVHRTPTRARGEYNAHFEIVSDSCDAGPVSYRRTNDVMPYGKDRAHLGLTGFWSEPATDLLENGGDFSFSFTRRWGYRYEYAAEGTVTPDSLTGKLKIDLYVLSGEQAGNHICSLTYAITDGFKRFQSYAVPEP